MVRNVHERLLPVPITEVGALLDRLGGPDDRLWPTPAWAPMTLDRPLAPGALANHGGIRSRVVEHRPQRSITFELEPGQGLHGRHTMSVHAVGPSSTVLRHAAQARLSGWMRLLWPLAVGPAHDALLEDLLDRAERELGTGPARPARWSRWVRLLRRFEGPRARETAVPDTPLLSGALPRVDFADAHAVRVFPGAATDPQVWADAVFGRPAPWVAAVLAAREALVGVVGIARSGSSSFDTVARSADEVLLGSDEGHLDFRCSVRREPERVVLSTVVQLHNRRGRCYFALVRRVHPVIARALLTRAARRLAGSSNPARSGLARMGA
ncbi:MAG TPA: DUF2867 domain-containing protein [Pseudonocardia sp.]|nr:DUF2867 domain-containing protein [Pseudonocardia sp.]